MCPGRDGTLVKSEYPWGNSPITGLRANTDGFELGCAAVSDYSAGDNAWGCRQLIGNVWEWTADTFNPFDGFSPDDYKEYSKPLFGTTKVLRGGHGRPEADISTLNIGIILGHNGRIFSVVSEHALRINKKLDLIEHRLRCSHDSADR